MTTDDTLRDLEATIATASVAGPNALDDCLRALAMAHQHIKHQATLLGQCYNIMRHYPGCPVATSTDPMEAGQSCTCGATVIAAQIATLKGHPGHKPKHIYGKAYGKVPPPAEPFDTARLTRGT